MSITNWSKNNVTNFYTFNRKSTKDLYLSEKYLLSKIKKKKIKKILDFGCAAGNFKNIFNKLYGSHFYCGIDADKKMIQIAKKINLKNKKKDKFIVRNNLKKIKEEYDLVFSTGVLNHIKNYKDIVNQMIEISDRYVFFDAPRITLKKKFTAKMNLSKRFQIKDKKNIVNYYIENEDSFLNFIKNYYKKNKCNIYILINKLPYSKKYLNIKSIIYYCTVLITKSDKKFIKVKTQDKRLLKIINAKIKK